MPNRRKFLRQTGAFALGSLIFSSCNSNENSSKEKDPSDVDSSAAADATDAKGTRHLGAIGVQLWSVKDVLENDIKGTLKQLADIGYKEIESFPGKKGHYYGVAPKEFAGLLNDNGLKLVSSHFGSGSRQGKSGSWQQATMLQNFEELAAKAAETGQQYLTCSWLDESLRKTPDDLKRTAELFNKTGESAKKAGLQFAYHNHDFEFKKVGDNMIYDYMLDNTDPQLVKWEMDMYWVVSGGQDPVAYFKKYPNRFPLGHAKDMDKQDRTKNTEVG